MSNLYAKEGLINLNLSTYSIATDYLDLSSFKFNIYNMYKINRFL